MIKSTYRIADFIADFFAAKGVKNIYSPLIVLSDQIFVTDEKANIYRLR